MGRQGGFQSRSRTRRLTDWGFGVDAGGLGLTATAKTLWTTALAISTPFTIVRLRGYAHISLLTASSAADGFAGAIGIALVNSDAFTAGVASIPGPLTDANWDGWFYHQFFDIRTVTGTIGDGVNAGAASQRIEIDSKAMRKWDPSETMVGVIDVTESGVATGELNANTRLLLKT